MFNYKQPMSVMILNISVIKKPVFRKDKGFLTFEIVIYLITTQFDRHLRANYVNVKTIS